MSQPSYDPDSIQIYEKGGKMAQRYDVAEIFLNPPVVSGQVPPIISS